MKTARNSKEDKTRNVRNENTVTEIMNAFDVLICREDRDKQRIKLLKDRSIEIF